MLIEPTLAALSFGEQQLMWPAPLIGPTPALGLASHSLSFLSSEAEGLQGAVARHENTECRRLLHEQLGNCGMNRFFSADCVCLRLQEDNPAHGGGALERRDPGPGVR